MVDSLFEGILSNVEHEPLARVKRHRCNPLPRWLRSRQERQSNGAFSGGTDSGRQHHRRPGRLKPGAGSTLTFNGEPLTLLIENAGIERRRAPFGCSSRSARTRFQQIASTRPIRLRSAATAGPPIACPRRLARVTPISGARARSTAPTAGPIRRSRASVVVPPVVIDAPVATAPAGKLNTNKPEFKVTNGAISGTSGVGYRFEVSRAATSARWSPSSRPVNGSGSTTMTPRRAALQDDLLLAREGQRRRDRIDLLEHAAVHHGRCARGAARRRWRRRAGGVPTGPADAPPAGGRCRATVRASSKRWRGRIRARSPTRARTTAAAGSSWTRSWTRFAPTTPAGATTASVATRTIRLRMRSPTTTGWAGRGLDPGLHHRHHRRPLRLDALAELERRDRRHVQSGTIGRWTSRGRF